MKIKTISLVLVSLAFLSVSCNDEFLEIGATGSLAEAQMITQEGVDGVDARTVMDLIMITQVSCFLFFYIPTFRL